LFPSPNSLRRVDSIARAVELSIEKPVDLFVVDATAPVSTDTPELDIRTLLKAGPVLAVCDRNRWEKFGALELSLAPALRCIESVSTTGSSFAFEVGQLLGHAAEKASVKDNFKNADDAARAHDKLASNHATLERWAAELEIANARLREVDELKTKFLSEVSHEIRTPLAAIVSAAKIIARHHEERPQVVERFSGTILSEGERLTRLINEFLDLTKIEAGCVDWRDTEVSPAGLLDDALNNVAALALEKDITLASRADTNLPAVKGDHDRLIQVLVNLLTNALKHTPRGDQISVFADIDGDAIRFEVNDSGPGIPEDEIAQVFDRFHQVRSVDGSKQGHRGTGLGLCICREIVEHYGGRVWVENPEQGGSSFRFTIPLVDKRPNEPQLPRTLAAEPHAPHVLLMLDDEGLAHSLVEASADSGIEWRFCNSPQEAAALLAGWRADVAVVSETIAEEFGSSNLHRLHSHGVASVLLHSPERGLVDACVLENSDAVAKSLRSIAAPGAEILVVEDDDQYRALLEFQLWEDGYRVVAVDNGKDALKKIATDPPDAVLLDLIMPGVDGMMVLEQVRTMHEFLPVTVLTALDDPAIAMAARELGAVGVFRKDTSESAPYRTVVARVKRVMETALESLPPLPPVSNLST
jgi:signal transduction histidine kinase/CheY-like chemotaxis protein